MFKLFKKLLCRILGHRYEIGLYEFSPEVTEVDIPCERCGGVMHFKMGEQGSYIVSFKLLE